MTTSKSKVGEKEAINKEDYKLNGWSYSKRTPVMIDGKKMIIQMEKGMTGIGSRHYSLNGKAMSRNCVTQSADLTKGNHSIYKINWRENPWDTVDLIIHEDEIKECWALSNLQPLEKGENRRKGCRYESETISNIQTK